MVVINGSRFGAFILNVYILLNPWVAASASTDSAQVSSTAISPVSQSSGRANAPFSASKSVASLNSTGSLALNTTSDITTASTLIAVSKIPSQSGFANAATIVYITSTTTRFIHATSTTTSSKITASLSFNTSVTAAQNTTNVKIPIIISSSNSSPVSSSIASSLAVPSSSKSESAEAMTIVSTTSTTTYFILPTSTAASSTSAANLSSNVSVTAAQNSTNVRIPIINASSSPSSASTSTDSSLATSTSSTSQDLSSSTSQDLSSSTSHDFSSSSTSQDLSSSSSSYDLSSSSTSHHLSSSSTSHGVSSSATGSSVATFVPHPPPSNAHIAKLAEIIVPSVVGGVATGVSIGPKLWRFFGKLAKNRETAADVARTLEMARRTEILKKLDRSNQQRARYWEARILMEEGRNPGTLTPEQVSSIRDIESDGESIWSSEGIPSLPNPCTGFPFCIDWPGSPPGSEPPSGPDPTSDPNPPPGPDPPSDPNPPSGPDPPSDPNPPSGPDPPSNPNPPSGPDPPSNPNPPPGQNPPSTPEPPSDPNPPSGPDTPNPPPEPNPPPGSNPPPGPEPPLQATEESIRLANELSPLPPEVPLWGRFEGLGPVRLVPEEYRMLPLNAKIVYAVKYGEDVWSQRLRYFKGAETAAVDLQNQQLTDWDIGKNGEIIRYRGTDIRNGDLPKGVSLRQFRKDSVHMRLEIIRLQEMEDVERARVADTNPPTAPQGPPPEPPSPPEPTPTPPEPTPSPPEPTPTPPEPTPSPPEPTPTPPEPTPSPPEPTPSPPEPTPTPPEPTPTPPEPTPSPPEPTPSEGGHHKPKGPHHHHNKPHHKDKGFKCWLTGNWDECD